MLKVLGRKTSINVRKVLWTADELGLGYEREDWGMPLRDPKVPDFLALNPNGLVPVIVDDGFVLHESTAIMRYLCQRQGDTGLLPDDLRTRSLVEQWLSWHGTELMPAWGYAVRALIRRLPGHDDPQKIADSVAATAAKVKLVADQLGRTRAFIVGDRLTLADIALGLSVHRWLLLPAEKPEMPVLEAYHERLRAETKGGQYMTGEFA
jgi:glutathione S-transferase